MTFDEFRKDIETSKKETLDRAWFNLYASQLPEEDRPYKVDQVMNKASMYIIDRAEGKPLQKNEHTGANGKDLFPQPLLGGQSNGISSNDSNQEVITT